MLIDTALVIQLCLGPQRGFGPGLIPEIQPFSEGHIRAQLIIFLPTAGLLQLFQLFQALGFGFRQNVLSDGKALVIVADNISTLPAPI